ncbi:hypothetical protein [Streptomyces sp. NPDC005732]|uniref:hypothetical protein n=1 Tax=Streptomyces sp. NPDC005732 TaxID=3157057 RepID=UPI0033EA7200
MTAEERAGFFRASARSFLFPGWLGDDDSPDHRIGRRELPRQVLHMGVWYLGGEYAGPVTALRPGETLSGGDDIVLDLSRQFTGRLDGPL